MIESMFKEFKNISESSEVIYDEVLGRDKHGAVTVDSMISDLPQFKDIIEDYCAELFAKAKKSKKK